ncbi:nucleoside triphosphate pyrophosphohydrolase, partial [Salmonella enterica subsp. enterica serovar Enteritidis]|nr:nucleoside triphosphate pyrophosphohydrolase [Salmonella enterica subsp. enterica serovar Enteritidis]
MKTNIDIQPLVEVVQKLRSPNGCPWDKVQTHESLRRYFIEETYEVVDAIDNKDMDNLREELGDVLLQIVFHSSIAEENGAFTLQDV